MAPSSSKINLDSPLWKTLDTDLLVNIVGFLPRSINCELQRRHAKWAVKKIVKAIRDNRIRMNIAMEYEIPSTVSLIRAHYILHYPEELRWEYLSVMRMHNSSMGNHNPILNDRALAENRMFPKKLFRKVIQSSTVKDLLSCGW